MYKRALDALKAIPEWYRSHNHAAYLNELTERIGIYNEMFALAAAGNITCDINKPSN